MSGVKWHLVGASIVFEKEGFATSGGKLVYELAYQQHGYHGILKNARFERMDGEASIGTYWRSGGTTMFRSIENVCDWVGTKQQANANTKSD